MHRKGYSSPLQKCIVKDNAEPILAKVHERIYSSHTESGSLAPILLREGYFRPQMQKDAKGLVKKCKTCQEHENIQRLPSKLITSADYPMSYGE